MTVGATPTGLAEGQISVGMADQPPTAWVGVPASVNPAGVIPITGLVRTVAGAPQPAGALGQLWWDEDAAQLFVYTGSEWVVAVNPPIPDVSGFLAKSGGTMVGALNVLDATAPSEPLTLGQANARQNRNRLLNGDFMLGQRDAMTLLTPNSGYTVCDRWSYRATQANQFSTQLQDGASPEGRRIVSLAANGAFTPGATDYFLIQQAIEYLNLLDLCWGLASAAPVTLSFWVTAPTGTYSGAITNNDFTRSYVFTYTASAGVWQKAEITIPGDTTGNWYLTGMTLPGLTLRFDLGSGATFRTTPGSWQTGSFVGANGSVSLVSGGTMYLANVQLERGPMATPFDWMPWGETLARCSRYFQVITAYQWGGWQGQTGNASVPAIVLPVPMRDIPTAWTGNMSYNNCTGVALQPSSMNVIQAYFQGISAVGMANAQGHVYANADI